MNPFNDWARTEERIAFLSELQEALQVAEPTFVTDFERKTGRNGTLITISTAQFGEQYSGEVFIADEVLRSEYKREMAVNGVARMCRSIQEEALPDDAPANIEDERDSPYFIDDGCPECGSELYIADEFASMGVYSYWDCPECDRDRPYVDSYEIWDGWV